MTQKEKQESLKSEKIKLSGLRKFTHFELSFFLLIFSVIFVIFYILGKYNIIGHGKTEPLTLLVLSGTPFVISILYYFRQKKQLKYYIINLKCTEEQILFAYQKTKEELKWIDKKTGKNYFILHTNPGFFSFNWGEEIKIIWNNEKVMINSICDPSSRAAIFSMGRNKKNVIIFKKYLNTANKNIT